jgi:cation diffusion facilitator CzcD-associated flavoprotein CzcO
MAEHVDVIIVGAGISGVGAGYHLQTQCPDKSFVILEGLDSFGGTWWMHRYPGVRSDSDLHTFGYRFKPWTGTPIASAEEILKYMGEVIEENDLDQHIRYNHWIDSAAWSSEDKTWTIKGKNNKTGEAIELSCNFLWMCQGYYKHSEGYTPEWAGMENYQGQMVHPQTWPEDLDYKGKKVLVIGSGATTATVVPAIAEDCEHVTVLQRSPTYFIPGRNINETAEHLRKLGVKEEWVHEIVRKEILFNQDEFTKRATEHPDEVKEELLGMVKAFLPEDYDMKHFTPRYRPWQQRIAFVPDGDIFKGIASGKASMVTDEIDHFTETGVITKGGETLDADIVITATGFNLCVLGDIEFSKDGEPIDFADTVTYRGMMFSDVPNMVWVFGYFRASWTLRVDLMGDFVCRLLKHMDEHNVKSVTPVLGAKEHNMPKLDWIDEDNFNPNYLKRSMHLMPKRGEDRDWQHTQDYWREQDEFPAIDLEGENFKYG